MGDGPQSVYSRQYANDTSRNHRESTPSSPLKIFVQAKKRINDVFVEIGNYMSEAMSFLEALPGDKEFQESVSIPDIKSYKSKIVGIQDVLLRDHMKVVFFGRTSNGKSTVINAMLGDKILPSGIGHTTNCFVQVGGTDVGTPYLITEGKSERQNVQSVSQLAHALCQEKLTEDSLMMMYWPQEKCSLLRDDVVFVDSPGIDVSPNLDVWIDKHCQDADVFVLVANAESTLMVTEKNFFHKVSELLSKPNVFVLNNRWDASANEMEFSDQVRRQHMDRNAEFLVSELGVCANRGEAENRIFFVSAKEVLQARLQEAKGLPPHANQMAEGFQERYFEFQDFERKFEECISKSAVKTKFEQHTIRGKTITNDIRTALEGLSDKAAECKMTRSQRRKEMWDRLDYTRKQLLLLTSEVKHQISNMVEEVEQKVSCALSEEIHRLGILVEEFSAPFHPDPLVLNIYKRELHGHVEQGLGSNLRSRLSTALALAVDRAQKDMTERMADLLPDDKKQISFTLFPRREPFEVLYRLQCENLCQDFREDLQFHFTLGFSTLFSRLFGRQGIKGFFYGNQPVSRGLPLSPSSPSLSEYAPVGMSQDDFSLVSKMAVGALSHGAMGGMLVTGFLLKTVGWRLIIVTTGLYGLLYLYERLTWTNTAKEKSFKKQYVDHTTKQLKLIVDLTSANCSHQVQQELSSTFARLCHLVDNSTDEMESEIKRLDQGLGQLEEVQGKARKLRNKAAYLHNQLDLFEQQYLRNSGQ